MAKSRKNNRFSNQNRRSKCRKHNIQRGGEITYVKALVNFVNDPILGNIAKGDIILQTNKLYDNWASGYNVTQGCASVKYPINDTYIQPYTPKSIEQENGNTCLQSSMNKAPDVHKSARVEKEQPSVTKPIDISKGKCGTKRLLVGRDNCVVLTSKSAKNTNKVVLYVHPNDIINVRYFENRDDTKYTDADQKVLTNEIIQDIIDILGSNSSVSEVKTSLQTFIYANKAEIYKGENMLSTLSKI
jgi:hypothetical protein